jgi:hypothetical protein
MPKVDFPSRPLPNREILQVRHIADYMGYAPKTVRRWLKLLLITAHKIENEWYVRRSSFEYFLSKRTVPCQRLGESNEEEREICG